MKPIRLTVNKYDIDTSEGSGKAEYRKITTAAKMLGHTLMRVYGTKPGYIDSLPHKVTLEPEFIFYDQYNASGFRVHDWYEAICQYHNKTRRVGYYLSGGGTALDTIKREHYVCGFCGHRHQGHDAPMTCPQCLGSKYLEESQLPLLVMQPLVGTRRTADGPSAEAYAKAQAEAKIEYTKKQGERRLMKANRLLVEVVEEKAQLQLEAEGHAATLRAGLDDDNLIYYKHTKEWVFGWRTTMTQEESERIRSVELPFDYRIKMADGTAR